MKFYFVNSEAVCDEFGNTDRYWGSTVPVCLTRETAEIDLKNWNSNLEDVSLKLTFDEMFHEATDDEIEMFGVEELESELN